MEIGGTGQLRIAVEMESYLWGGQDVVIAEDDGLGIFLVRPVVVEETQIGVELVVIAEC